MFGVGHLLNFDYEKRASTEGFLIIELYFCKPIFPVTKNDNLIKTKYFTIFQFPGLESQAPMLHDVCTIMNVINQSNQQTGFHIRVEICKLLTEVHQTGGGFFMIRVGLTSLWLIR